MLAGACSGRGRPEQAARTVTFACENGRQFAVQFLGNRIRVATSAGNYLLDHRPSSIGAAYVSDEAAFIQDEDRGVLEGADGGPYRQCHESA
jgi:hypothetical protein